MIRKACAEHSYLIAHLEPRETGDFNTGCVFLLWLKIKLSALFAAEGWFKKTNNVRILIICKPALDSNIFRFGLLCRGSSGSCVPLLHRFPFLRLVMQNLVKCAI